MSRVRAPRKPEIGDEMLNSRGGVEGAECPVEEADKATSKSLKTKYYPY